LLGAAAILIFGLGKQKFHCNRWLGFAARERPTH
jgi:hypothetical protein